MIADNHASRSNRSRFDWEFTIELNKLKEAIQKKIKHHQEKVAHWTKTRNSTPETLSYAAQRDSAGRKAYYHQDLQNEYTAWHAFFTARRCTEPVKLKFNDWLYFFGIGVD